MAGQNATLLIQPYDKYGNLLNLTNTLNDLQRFTNISQVYYSKVSLQGQEYYQAAPCFEVLIGRIRCSAVVTEKGFYKWRYFVNGE